MSCVFTPCDITPCKYMLPTDCDMVDEVYEIYLQGGNLERIAAYRECQALYAALKQTSGRDITDFEVPKGIIFREVGPGQRHVTIPSDDDPDMDVPYIVPTNDDNDLEEGDILDASVCLVTGEFDPESLRSLTIGMDRGGVGAAQAFFTEGMVKDPERGQRRYMISSYCDKYHACIRGMWKNNKQTKKKYNMKNTIPFFVSEACGTP